MGNVLGIQIMRYSKGWAIILVAVLLVLSEIYEHQILYPGRVDPFFAGEVLLFGLVLPLGALFIIRSAKAIHKAVASVSSRNESRVLVVEDKMMCELVKGLLKRDPAINVVGVTPVDADALNLTIQEFKPDVVVIDKDSTFVNGNAIMESLRDYPEVRVLVVSAASDYAQIYDMRRVRIGGGKDLATIIQSE